MWLLQRCTAKIAIITSPQMICNKHTAGPQAKPAKESVDIQAIIDLSALTEYQCTLLLRVCTRWIYPCQNIRYIWRTSIAKRLSYVSRCKNYLRFGEAVCFLTGRFTQYGVFHTTELGWPRSTFILVRRFRIHLEILWTRFWQQRCWAFTTFYLR